ncbi:MAG: hypothetical protein MJ200_02800 [Mycoplasmoidaceae bacterium]|nr:hypothetical protein [Mycoplasmoidaceae bacterium]
MLFDFFDPTKTYAFDVYVNAILSLDHDYNHQDSVPSDLQDAKLSLTDDAAAKGNEVKLQALVNMSSVFAEEKYVVNVNPSIKNDLLSYYNANLGALYDVTAGNCATNTTLITS